MRNAFAGELTKLASNNLKIVLLSGDMGNHLFDKYKVLFPERFYNCGVAESNMTGIAAGMALAGLKPVTYSIAPFITIRCLEQIKIDICYHNLPVVIIGTGAGLSYAGLGTTHQSCDDIAMLRVIPNISIVCPGDAMEVRGALRAALNHNGPVYLRLGKKDEPLIHKIVPVIEIGKSLIIKRGRNICLLSTGNLLPLAANAAENLTRLGISTQLVSFHTIKPLDETLLSDVFSSFQLVVTLEEHSRIGGLGGSVAEWLSEMPPQHSRFYRFALPDVFYKGAGDQNHVRDYFGITKSEIVQQVIKNYRNCLGSGDDLQNAVQ